MDDRGKRRLFRALCDALTEAGVPLDYVHFSDFQKRADRTPIHDRYVHVTLYEIQQKVGSAVPGRTYASWKGTGRYRISVQDNGNLCRVVSIHARREGFDLAAVVAKVSEYVAVVRNAMSDEERRELAQRDNERERGRLVQAFNLEGFSDTENLGWRRNIAPIEVESHWDGLTVNFNRRLTPDEVHQLLRTAGDLGLLPGGVREKDRATVARTKSRYERV